MQTAMAALLSIAVLVLVLGLYGRSVASNTRHALGMLMRYLTLVLGLAFVLAMLLLLVLAA
jgi:hypothetical protein